jgi:ribonuclease D
MDDLPHDIASSFKGAVAIDTETMGLNVHRDRLCLVQISNGDNVCHLVKIRPDGQPARHLIQVIEDETIEKIFHFARFDIAALYSGLGALCKGPIYCTKIASKMARTYTQYHGLASLCRDVLQTELSKGEQCSDWGQDELTPAQKQYAAKDVLYLHRLKSCLTKRLEREGRYALFYKICQFLPTRALADVQGFPEDIFAH